MVLTDLSINFVHSVIWDIGADVLTLPEGIATVANPTVPAGSKQAAAWNGTIGYAGPCPGSPHTYEFRVYAVDALPLPDVSTNSDRVDVVDVLEASAIASTALTATYTP
jgi:phosphatidylethanolamine-binding protein (PEBP) family uncharacterized protein